LENKKLARIASLIRSFGYFSIMGVFGLLTSSLGPILPDLSKQVAAPLDVLSLIFTARAFGFLFGSLLGGKLFDKYKGHPLYTISFLLLSLIIIMIPFTTSIWMLVGTVFLQGITLGFVVVGASTFIVWEHPHNPGPWLNTQSFINGVGGFLSPLIISFSISRFGSYPFSFWFYALLACLTATLFFFTKSPPIRKIEKTELSEEKHTPGLMVLIALAFLLYVGAEVSYNGWIFSIATTAYSLSATNARLLNSIFWGSIAIGRLAGIPISRRVRADRILIISFIGSVVSVLAAILFPYSVGVLWAGTIGVGLFMALIFPSMLMYVEKQMHLSGKKTGMIFSATSVGGMLLPWISGQLFTRFSPHAVKGVVLISLMAGFAVFLYVRKLIHSKEMQQ